MRSEEYCWLAQARMIEMRQGKPRDEKRGEFQNRDRRRGVGQRRDGSNPGWRCGGIFTKNSRRSD
jgi:hypothetical protein